ncbi:hypothetical protein ABIC83_002395 [Roseateles asaccharophilus]|uniref:hypothetical protein n=1 Tax=Roseateles asaccharophilus TaxID=582607 RepID=UPI0038348CC2
MTTPSDLSSKLLANHGAIEAALGRSLSEVQLQELAHADAFLSNIGVPLASDLIVALGKLKTMDLTGVKPAQTMRTLEVAASIVNDALAGR